MDQNNCNLPYSFLSYATIIVPDKLSVSLFVYIVVVVAALEKYTSPGIFNFLPTIVIGALFKL